MDTDTIQEAVETAGAVETASVEEDFKAKYEEAVAEKTRLESERNKALEISRTHQSERDKAAKFESKWRKKVQSLEKTIESLRAEFEDEPELVRRIDHEFTKGKLGYHEELEKEGTPEDISEREKQEFVKEANRIFMTWGVDPKDPALAGATTDAKSKDEALVKLAARAREIALGGSKVKAKEKSMEDIVSERVAAEIAKIRKEQGLDTEGANVPPVGTSGKKKYTRGDVKNYDPAGKSVQQVGKDLDDILDQYTSNK